MTFNDPTTIFSRSKQLIFIGITYDGKVRIGVIFWWGTPIQMEFIGMYIHASCFRIRAWFEEPIDTHLWNIFKDL